MSPYGPRWLFERIPRTSSRKNPPILNVAGLTAEGSAQFLVDLGMSIVAPREWDSQIAVGVYPAGVH